MRSIIEGEKQDVDNNGIGDGQTYSNVDLPNSAAAYKNTETSSHTFDVNEQKLIRKVDLRVVPVLSILYLLAFLDRTNIANAAVFGLADDIGLKGTQYNTALTIFFVPYVIFEIPSNILLKRLKPPVWLSGCMFMFGLVTICQGLVHNFGGLATTRFFLGFFESGIFPGSFYLIGMWYKRHEAQKRYTLFFASTTLAGAFGGLLASAIGKMDGLYGYRGWRWIFILEGVLTCVASVIIFFVLPDFPEKAEWLSDEEREFIKARLQDDQGKSALERKILPKDVANCFMDYKFILGGLMYFGLIVPAYGYAYFAPSIIKTYGYSAIETQLRSVPPWAAAFAVSMFVATCSDWLRHRFLFTIIPICMSIAGFTMLMRIHHETHTEYGALFLITSGTYSAMPVVICWFTMNLGGHHRRAIGSAWQIGFGNIGGIIATYSFGKGDAKTFFYRGYSICLGFICLSAFSCLLYFIACVTQNRKRDTLHEIGKKEDERVDMGDMSPDYRYML